MTETDGWLQRYEETHRDVTYPVIYWAAVNMVVVGTVEAVDQLLQVHGRPHQVETQLHQRPGHVAELLPAVAQNCLGAVGACAGRPC